MKITQKSFPSFIKKIRGKNGWNTEEMGKRLGVSQRTIEGWEQGRTTPKPLIPMINLLVEMNNKQA